MIEKYYLRYSKKTPIAHNASASEITYSSFSCEDEGKNKSQLKGRLTNRGEKGLTIPEIKHHRGKTDEKKEEVVQDGRKSIEFARFDTLMDDQQPKKSN